MGCGVSAAAQSSGGSVDAYRKQLKDTSPAVRAKAATALGDAGESGAAAIAELAEALKDSDAAVRQQTGKAIGKLSQTARGSDAASSIAADVAQLLMHDNHRYRTSAEEALKLMGKSATPAMPQLCSALAGEADSCERALNVLAKIPPPGAAEAAPQLARLLGGKPEIRSKSEAILLQLGEDAAGAVGELAALLPSGEFAQCPSVLRILGSLGPHAAPVAPAMARLLPHGDFGVRTGAKEALLRLGAAATGAAAELAGMVRDDSPEVRLSAAQILGNLEPSALVAHAPQLVDALRSEDDIFRRALQETLGKLANKDPDFAAAALSALALLLLGEEPGALGALEVFERMGGGSAPVADKIAGALAHPALSVRDKTAQVLRFLSSIGCADAAVPIVMGLLEHKDSSVRMSSASALRGLGGIARSSSSELAKMLGSDLYDVRRRAIDTLQGMGMEASAAAPEIAMLLANENPDIREVAAEALDKMGPEAAASGVVGLLPILTHRKDYVREAAAACVQKLGEYALPVVQNLLQTLPAEEWQDSRRIVEQLGKLPGAVAAPFLPVVSPLLDAEHLELQIVAARLIRDVHAKTGSVAADMLARAEQLYKTSLQFHAPPSYWTNKDADEFDEMVYVDSKYYAAFNKLLKDAYFAKATQDRPCPKGVCGKTKGGCPCVQPGGDPGLPTEYLVRRVVRVENALMWARYVMKRDAIRLKRSQEAEAFKQFDPPIMSAAAVSATSSVFSPLEADLNEAYLLHGTFVRAAVSIAKSNFSIDKAGSNVGTMYGAGAYLGEAITKADEYAKDEPGGYYDGVMAVLLCRTVMGKMYFTTQRDEEAGTKVKTGNYDGTIGDRSKSAGTFRELVVYDSDQIYPEYIVFYERAYAKSDRALLDKRLSTPLYLEIPSYWTNCYKDLRASPFDERYNVATGPSQTLQKLVDTCLETGGQKWKIAEAWRVENSTTWHAYVAFKAKLRQKHGEAGCQTAEKLYDASDAGQVLTTKCLQKEPFDRTLSVAQLEIALNEHYAWHATSKEACEKIASTNFKIERSEQATVGLRFGPGAYFAENLGKALSYSKDEAGKKYALLCRLACGEFYYTESMKEADVGQKAMAGGKDSILANPKQIGPREFVALEESQVYPEFILELEQA
eukprot:TRINITY_DN38528_c0_g1_i1.p1 TRINITY_DN38528_c0_g1~~TRINITY_DN38528_c0_g1_i1.p1  ORF type:complete len:1139 (+),score=306.19 TRINITY_DN38528_c0_g1_i1:82-3498(+)